MSKKFLRFCEEFSFQPAFLKKEFDILLWQGNTHVFLISTMSPQHQYPLVLFYSPPPPPFFLNRLRSFLFVRLICLDPEKKTRFPRIQKACFLYIYFFQSCEFLWMYLFPLESYRSRQPATRKSLAGWFQGILLHPYFLSLFSFEMDTP